jgi:hypothetical protein
MSWLWQGDNGSALCVSECKTYLRPKNRVMYPFTHSSCGTVLGNSGKYITLETSKSNGILKVCFSGAGNSRIQELWDLRSLEFAGVQSSGNSVRRRCGVMNMRKPGISTVGGPDFGDLPIRESNEDSVRDSGAGIRANLRRSEGHFGNLLETWFRNFGWRHPRITGEAKSKL